MTLRIFIHLGLLLLPLTAYANDIPVCRLDHNYDGVVRETAQRVLAAFKTSGKNIGLDQAVTNPVAKQSDSHTLSIYVVTDAPADAVSAKGCASRKLNKGDNLDKLSVKGGCFVNSVDNHSILCSSDAVRLFAFGGDNADRLSPALLYVLAHEIGHIYQKRSGEYSGRVNVISLAADQASKIRQLRERCTPTLTEQEEQADEYSLDVLRTSLGKAPYREEVFSEQGSLFWNIDLLALAADKWAAASAEREFTSQPPMHKSFEPTEFPTPPRKIKLAAKKLVCDVIKDKTGTVSVPAVSSTHPPAEQRLRRIAEVLKPVAQALPKTGGSKQHQPIVLLQQDLGPIFTQIYRETGVYLEALESEICTLVNSPEPQKSCR